MNGIKDRIKVVYGEAARQARAGGRAGCGCDTSCCQTDVPASRLYDAAETEDLPREALLASLGCGNPTLLADLKPGNAVLDLGSGGGIDVLLSAKRVGPTGKAYGLDMTDEMLALARENQRKSGLTNVEFLRGDIEEIPLPSRSIDVVLSNCVINLAGDKARVFAEAFRVLKPSGRFAASDILRTGDAPATPDQERWASCLDGAIDEGGYREKLAEAGFIGIEIQPGQSTPGDAGYVSAFVRAVKPPDVEDRACCGPACCS